MKNAKTVLLLLALLTLLPGCIASQRELAMSRDLEEMKRRLAATERELATQQTDRVGQTRQRLDTLTQQQAKAQADLDNLRLELQSINGRFADLDRQRNESQEELALIRDDLGLRISALEEQKSSGTAPAAQASIATPTQPETIYLQAVDTIRKQKQYANGRKQLEAFLQQNPKHALAPNAAYWIGESYLGEKEYEKAILQFEEVIQTYGEHPKAASAYLKQALTFEQLGDRKSARAILEKLTKSFPLSEEAQTAKQRLKTLGK